MLKKIIITVSVLAIFGAAYFYYVAHMSPHHVSEDGGCEILYVDGKIAIQRLGDDYEVGLGKYFGMSSNRSFPAHVLEGPKVPTVTTLSVYKGSNVVDGLAWSTNLDDADMRVLPFVFSPDRGVEYFDDEGDVAKYLKSYFSVTKIKSVPIATYFEND